MPPYEVLEKKDGYEIRRYEKQYLAQMTYEVPKTTDFLRNRERDFIRYSSTLPETMKTRRRSR